MNDQYTFPDIGFAVADAIGDMIYQSSLREPMASVETAKSIPEATVDQSPKKVSGLKTPSDIKESNNSKETKIEPVSPEPKKAEQIIPRPEKSLEPRLLPADKLVPQDYFRQSPHFFEVANYFQIPKDHFEDAKHNLSLIVDWAAYQSQSSKVGDIMREIQSLERRLPPPEAGERRYKNVFRFVKLSQT